MKKLKLSKSLIVLACVAAALIGVQQMQHARSETDLDDLFKGESEGRHGWDVTKNPARKQRAWQLYELWMARDKRDVAPEVVPYLQDEYMVIRRSAARILGRLEKPVGERPLQEALDRVQQRNLKNYIDPVTVKLSLGRIRSRGLKGEAKFAAVAKSVNLSVNDTAQLTARYVAARSRANGSPSETITRELVDVLYTMSKRGPRASKPRDAFKPNVLYTMSKRGENIQPLVKRLTLYPVQRIKLQGATLSTAKEAELIMDYLSPLDIVTPRDGELMEHLTSFSPAASRLITARLARDARQKQPEHLGYSEIFGAAALTGESQVPDLLQHFEENPKSNLKGHAMMARKSAEHRTDWSSSFCQYPPLP